MGTKIKKNLLKYLKKNYKLFICFTLGAVLFFVFAAGYQVGAGNWNTSLFSRKNVNSDLPNTLDYSSVNKLYQQLKAKYDGKLSIDKLMIGLKQGLVAAAGDPYTTYFDSTQAKDFNNQLSGTISGIGAQLGVQGSNIIIIAPIAGSPADKAGIRPQDVILQIDSTATSGMTIDQAVSKIRGNAGSTVSLTLLRGDQKITLQIVRQTITIPSVSTKILEGNIGYIQISQFGDDTAQLVESAAKDFKTKGVSGVILDVRDNPGGYLSAAVSVSGEWLKKGDVIVQEKNNNVVTQTYSAQLDGPLVGMPTVVLINGGSASASEITAGALMDNKAATIMGTKSFGKGSVQEFSNFSNGEMLKVTVAHWFTPQGNTIDKTGIKPMQSIALTDEQIRAGHDIQLQSAEALLQK